MIKNYFFLLAVFLISATSLAQVSGINQLEESTPAALGAELPGCTDPIACNFDVLAVVSDNALCTYEGVFSLNVDNLTNVGNGDVIVRVQDLQGGGIAAQVNMTNAENADYPVCVLNGCYTFKIVANGANVGFVATLTINGEALPVTYNNQNVSFGDGNCIQGCSVQDACTYDPAVNILDYSTCTFAQEGFDCDGNCLSDPVDIATLSALSPFQMSEADCETFTQGPLQGIVDFDGIASTYELVQDLGNGQYSPIDDPVNYTIDDACLVQFGGGLTFTFNSENNTLESLAPEPFEVYYYGATCALGTSLAPEASGGCTDETACNYDPAAVNDDGTCEFLSCSCGTAVFDMEVEQDCLNLETAAILGNFGFGCAYPSDFNIAWNGNDEVGYLIPSSGAEAAYVDLSFCEITYQDALTANYVSAYGLSDVHGLVPGNTFIVHTEDGNYYAVGDIQETDIQPTSISLDFAFRLIDPPVGCTDETACNYDPAAVNDDGTCEFLSCAGCTIEVACNYDPNASIADYESCEFVSCRGCTYSEAENYNASASIDDGSCTYVEWVTCMGDFNNDGAINTGDLVLFLGVFGGTCEEI